MEIEKRNDILLIKDYYNACYESIKASLEYLAHLENGRKIAVLGDIKEVGEFSEEVHRKIGAEVEKNKIDKLITVGKEAKKIAKEAKQKGMEEKNIYVCDTNEEAVKCLKVLIQAGDKVLLKASNSMKFGEIYDKIK